MAGLKVRPQHCSDEVMSQGGKTTVQLHHHCFLFTRHANAYHTWDYKTHPPKAKGKKNINHNIMCCIYYVCKQIQDLNKKIIQFML